jgi:hypothetical protein
MRLTGRTRQLIAFADPDDTWQPRHAGRATDQVGGAGR